MLALFVNWYFINSVDSTGDDHSLVSVVEHQVSSLKYIATNYNIILLGLSETLLSLLVRLFSSSWPAILKTLDSKFDVSRVFSFFMVAVMLGGSFFKFIFLGSLDAASSAKKGGIFFLIGLLTMYFARSFEVALLGCVLFQIAYGMILPSYNMMKTRIDRRYSVTVVNIFNSLQNVSLVASSFIDNSSVSLIDVCAFMIGIAGLSCLLQMCLSYEEREHDKSN